MCFDVALLILLSAFRIFMMFLWGIYQSVVVVQGRLIRRPLENTLPGQRSPHYCHEILNGPLGIYGMLDIAFYSCRPGSWHLRDLLTTFHEIDTSACPHWSSALDVYLVLWKSKLSPRRANQVSMHGHTFFGYVYTRIKTLHWSFYN